MEHILFGIGALACLTFVFVRRNRLKSRAYLESYPKCDLTNEEIVRYGRQLILPGFGVAGQIALKTKGVLIVGAGGIASTVIPLLAGAGFGRIGIVDNDCVEINNLHRQIMHDSIAVGENKAVNAARRVKQLNPLVFVVPYAVKLTAENALTIIKEFDMAVDATDNLETTYVINDACYFLNRPFVSGSAQAVEGQVAIYLPGTKGCYRCAFPKPPPIELRGNCADDGVLGPLPALIGSIQALENKLLQVDGKTLEILSINLPERRSQRCRLCGPVSSIKTLKDSHEFCLDNDLPFCPVRPRNFPFKSISCEDYIRKIMNPGIKHLLLDVRQPVQAEICGLPGNVNIPFDKVRDKYDEILSLLQVHGEGVEPMIITYCRRGVFSQEAARILVEECKMPADRVMNLEGGLLEWSRKVDPSLPIY